LRTYPLSMALAAVLSFAGAACGDSEKEPIDTPLEQRDGGGKPPPKDSGVIACTKEGETKACTCGAGKYGERTCKKSVYSECDCSASPSRDGGPKPGPTEALCKPGYFTGNFKGKYRPGAFGGGILPSGFEVDIEGGMALFGSNRPPLSFTLEEELSGGGEFQTFTVKGGCMQGMAKAFFITENPFVAKLTGSLDCETGEFVGALDGYYTLLNLPGANFYFRGPLTAQFELADESLKNGEWMVEEPPALSGDAAGGGQGSWDSKWTAAKGPEFEIDPCETVPAKDDAGVPLAAPTIPPTTPMKDGGAP
jgi:hypothetical protein